MQLFKDHWAFEYGFPRITKCCEDTCGVAGEYYCSNCDHVVCAVDSVSYLLDPEVKICGHCARSFEEVCGSCVPKVVNDYI